MATNYLIINRVSLADEFGLVLQDFETSSAEPKLHELDLPSSDSVIDLTEAITGDVSYSDRNFNFSHFVNNTNMRDFEKLKTEIMGFLHGRRYDFQLSWDEGYTYNGRFFVNEMKTSFALGRIVISATVKPYKSKGLLTLLINAAGGVVVNLPCGRKRQRPKIEVQRRSLISNKGTSWTLDPGTYLIRDLWLTHGNNEVVINTYPEYGGAVWTEYSTNTWTELADKRWFDIAAGDDPVNVPYKWTQYTDNTWLELAGKKWAELAHPAQPGDEYSAYIQYDWSDL